MPVTNTNWFYVNTKRLYLNLNWGILNEEPTKVSNRLLALSPGNTGDIVALQVEKHYCNNEILLRDNVWGVW